MDEEAQRPVEPDQESPKESVVWHILCSVRRVPPAFLLFFTPVALWVAFLPTVLALLFFGGGYLLYRWARKYLREEGEELADW